MWPQIVTHKLDVQTRNENNLTYKKKISVIDHPGGDNSSKGPTRTVTASSNPVQKVIIMQLMLFAMCYRNTRGKITLGTYGV